MTQRRRGLCKSRYACAGTVHGPCTPTSLRSTSAQVVQHSTKNDTYEQVYGPELGRRQKGRIRQEASRAGLAGMRLPGMRLGLW